MALSLFARYGYEATTLSQLAQAVGIRKPSLYNHIESKQALFLALVEEVEAAFFAALETNLEQYAGADAHTRLYELMRALTCFILEDTQGRFYKRYLLFPPEPLIDAIRAINDRSEKRMDVALQALHAQGRAENAWPDLSERCFLDAFYCLMDGLFSERFIYSAEEYKRRIDSIWPVFRAGLTAAA
jgi:AcrR family transcriptional regulator